MSEEWSKRNEGKQWFRLAATQDLFKICKSIIQKSTKVRIHSEAAALLPVPPERDTWEPELYKMVGKKGDKYKCLVEYAHMKYVELRFKLAGGKYELLKVLVDVEYPSEFNEDDSGGFDSANIGGFSGTKDGAFKAMAAFSSSNAVKLGKVKYKPKKKIRAPKKMASGHKLYSAMGTQEIKTRKYDPNQSAMYHDSSEDKDFITPEMRTRFHPHHLLCSRNYGDVDDEKVPADKILEIFETAKEPMSKFIESRLVEVARYDADDWLTFDDVMNTYNRVLQEQEKGSFHMTVRELMDLFVQSDADKSGMLEAAEISNILNEVHCVTDVEQIKRMMADMDKDDDAMLDFEEFLTLCQIMYKDRGGYVVANKGGPVTFNQTRILLTDLADRVERNHLQIEHLKTQIGNFDEQIEIMDTIQQHSSLQSELNKTREEKARLRKLHEQMEMQHRGWMRDLKGIHAREKRDVMEKIKFIEQQTDEGKTTFEFVKDAYEDDFGEAMQEVEEAKGAVQAVLDFTAKSVENTIQDTSNISEMKRLALERMARYKEGRKGTVFSTAVYDSASAIHAFLQNKTSAMEKWLISRTQFTQQDRERYLKRVEEVKKQREEFEENTTELTKQLDVVIKKTKDLQKKYDAEATTNKGIMDQLHQPGKREHDEALAKQLQQELDSLQEEIANGHNMKFEWTRKLYPKEHELGLHRHSIRLLQVELGELKILMNNVHHHKLVDARFTRNAKRANERVNKRAGDAELARLGGLTQKASPYTASTAFSGY